MSRSPSAGDLRHAILLSAQKTGSWDSVEAAAALLVEDLLLPARSTEHQIITSYARMLYSVVQGTQKTCMIGAQVVMIQGPCDLR